MSSPDLFVVCKSCGAEVSPYITECPYCGNRLRKRAPKLDSADRPAKAPRRGRGTRRAPRTGTPRSLALRGGRPYGTIALVALSVVATIVATLSATVAQETVVLGRELESALAPSDGLLDEPWRAVTSLFVYATNVFEVVVLGIVFLFGWLLERRHGAWAPVLVFLVTGAASVFAAWAVSDSAALVGAPGAAAGLLAAWSVPHLLDLRRGAVDEDVDLLGAAAFAAVLLALPAVVDGSHWLTGFAGAAAGLLIGLPLARLARE